MRCGADIPPGACRGSSGRPGLPDQDHTARAAGAQCTSVLATPPVLGPGPDTVHSLISIRFVLP